MIKADWDAHTHRPHRVHTMVKTPPPNLFGQDFNVTDAPNRYRLPALFSLHA